MSIYISIPSLFDTELIDTVKESLDNADDRSSIYIGIAYQGAVDEWCIERAYGNQVKHFFRNEKNVIIKEFNISETYGVGRGRNLAASMYSGQDYFLQIDSHTKFEKSWDTTLINLFNEALAITKNEKTILTGYLAPYKNYIGEGRGLVTSDTIPSYPYWKAGSYIGSETIIPRWITLPNSLKPEKYWIKEKFVACAKFNANFAFGNKFFAEDRGCEDSWQFFEEEPLQTFNLIKLGFSFVFPNSEIGLSHLYGNQLDSVESLSYRRQVDSSAGTPNWQASFAMTNKNYQNYLDDKNNKPQLEKFKDYAKFDPELPTEIDWYIPEYYINGK